MMYSYKGQFYWLNHLISSADWNYFTNETIVSYAFLATSDSRLGHQTRTSLFKSVQDSHYCSLLSSFVYRAWGPTVRKTIGMSGGDGLRVWHGSLAQQSLLACFLNAKWMAMEVSCSVQFLLAKSRQAWQGSGIFLYISVITERSRSAFKCW